MRVLKRQKHRSRHEDGGLGELDEVVVEVAEAVFRKPRARAVPGRGSKSGSVVGDAGGGMRGGG